MAQSPAFSKMCECAEQSFDIFVRFQVPDVENKGKLERQRPSHFLRLGGRDAGSKLFPHAAAYDRNSRSRNAQCVHDLVFREIGSRYNVIRSPRYSVQHRLGVTECAPFAPVCRRTEVNYVHDGDNQRSTMKKRCVEMRNVQKVRVTGSAGDQQLLEERIDGHVDNGHIVAERANADRIPFPDDGLYLEAVRVVMEFLEQIPRVRTDPSHQPTRVDCDCLGHGQPCDLMDSKGVSTSSGTARTFSSAVDGAG